MIAGLKPYAEYRDTGDIGLGQLPHHWDVKRSKYLFREVEQRSSAGTETRLSMSQRHGLIPSSQVQERRLVSETNVGGKLCLAGDLVLNRLKAHLGVLALAPIDGLVSPDYTVLRPTGTTNQRYFCEVYRSPYCGQELRRRAKGIVEGFWRLYTDDFYDIRVPVPPPEEQAAIVRFLDWANGRLERAIRAKRKVIALLIEQRNAVIQRAVTQGLDSGAPLKASGIPWLGEIPRHWDVRRLGGAISVLTGYPFASAEFVRHEGAVRLLRGVNVTPSGVRWTEVVRWQRRPGDGLEQFELQAGDIVLGMDRPVVGTGVRATRIEVADTPSLLLQRVARLRPTERLHARFLLLLLRGGTFSEYIVPIFTGISVPHLSPEQIKGFKVALPPIREQEAIADSVERGTAAIANAVARIEREIDLLREYRSRLVADLVTGKLDVRKAAARLPDIEAPPVEIESHDEADDPELIDEEATEA